MLDDNICNCGIKKRGTINRWLQARKEFEKNSCSYRLQVDTRRDKGNYTLLEEGDETKEVLLILSKGIRINPSATLLRHMIRLVGLLRQ